MVSPKSQQATRSWYTSRRSASGHADVSDEGTEQPVVYFSLCRSNPDIVKSGFKKAGITEALEKGLPEADLELDLRDLSENDPFSSDSD